MWEKEPRAGIDACLCISEVVPRYLKQRQHWKSTLPQYIIKMKNTTKKVGHEESCSLVATFCNNNLKAVLMAM